MSSKIIGPLLLASFLRPWSLSFHPSDPSDHHPAAVAVRFSSRRTSHLALFADRAAAVVERWIRAVRAGHSFALDALLQAFRLGRRRADFSPERTAELHHPMAAQAEILGWILRIDREALVCAAPLCLAGFPGFLDDLAASALGRRRADFSPVRTDELERRVTGPAEILGWILQVGRHDALAVAGHRLLADPVAFHGLLARREPRSAGVACHRAKAGWLARLGPLLTVASRMAEAAWSLPARAVVLAALDGLLSWFSQAVVLRRAGSHSRALGSLFDQPDLGWHVLPRVRQAAFPAPDQSFDRFDRVGSFGLSLAVSRRDSSVQHEAQRHGIHRLQICSLLGRLSRYRG
jgi:hypothetical protein